MSRKLTGDDARAYLADIERRFEQGGKRKRAEWLEEYEFDHDLEETGFQYPGAAAGYWDIPNR
jgi:hypothetical protein